MLGELFGICTCTRSIRWRAAVIWIALSESDNDLSRQLNVAARLMVGEETAGCNKTVESGRTRYPVSLRPSVGGDETKLAAMSFLRSIWRGNSKHKKLCEEWALASSKSDNSETPPDGVSFVVKYLGSTLVETPSNEEATAEAIKTIITMAKASSKKLQRVAISVNLQGIKVIDIATEDIHLDISIYRISYCSADAAHDHVFAFIATNSNETMECHAFLCPKRKMAQAVTLTVAQSFNTAYELWQLSQERSQIHNQELVARKESSIAAFHKHSKDDSDNQNSLETGSKTLLIDFSSEPETYTENGNPWVCFDDDRTEYMNDKCNRTVNQNPLVNNINQSEKLCSTSSTNNTFD